MTEDEVEVIARKLQTRTQRAGGSGIPQGEHPSVQPVVGTYTHAGICSIPCRRKKRDRVDLEPPPPPAKSCSSSSGSENSPRFTSTVTSVPPKKKRIFLLFGGPLLLHFSWAARGLHSKEVAYQDASDTNLLAQALSQSDSMEIRHVNVLPFKRKS